MRMKSSLQASQLLRLCLLRSHSHQTKLSMSTNYWNREEHAESKHFYKKKLEGSPDLAIRPARILSLSSPVDDSNASLHLGTLPHGAKLLSVGTTLGEFSGAKDPNVLMVSPSCPKAKEVLLEVLRQYPTIEWVHCRSAGIDFVESEGFASTCVERGVRVTNAKGTFSSTLAEYSLFACSYFAKNIPRLSRQKLEKKWLPYDVEELRGKTMGIVGYGDIGRACAKLAKSYGMRVLALRRTPSRSRDDPLPDVLLGPEGLRSLAKESDYVVCAAPSAPGTRGMIDEGFFRSLGEDAVFVNVGRGDVVDEEAMVRALTDGTLKGAALDVFAVEPLPEESPLWDLRNVLLSPHNMDQTATFMHEAAEFFVDENLPRFLMEEELLNPVDPVLSY